MKILIKYTKLFESIGLLLILVSWILHNIYIERFNSAIQTLNASYNSTFQMYSALQNTANIRLESAINRYLIMNPDLIVHDSTNYYEEVWNSVEVRRQWIVTIFNDYISIDSLINDFNATYSKFEIEKDTNLIKAKTILDSLGNHIHNIVPIDKITANTFPLQALERFPIFETRIISGLASSLNESMLYSYKTLLIKLTEVKNNHTTSYILIFIMGTLFTVSAKLIDWFHSKNKIAK